MKKNKLLACFLGIVFGFLFSIPWITFYVLFGGYWAFLSILTVFGIILGFKLGNKKIYNTKKTRLYIIIASILIMIINVAIVIPIVTVILFKIINAVSYASKTKASLNITELVSYYKSNSYLLALLLNIFLSVVTTVIPAIFIPMDYNKSETELSDSQIFKNEVEKIFEKNNAISKQTAIDKKIVKEEIKNINMGEFKKFWYLDLLKGIKIKSKKGKWYYKKGKKGTYRYGIWFSVLILIIITSVMNPIVNLYNKENNFDKDRFFIKDNEQEVKEEVKKAELIEFVLGDKISMLMPDCMAVLKTEEDNTNNLFSYYYSYVSVSDEKTSIKLIEMYYTPEYNLYSYDDLKNQLRESLSKYTILEENDKLINNNNTIYFKLDNVKEGYFTKSYFMPINGQLFEVYIYVNKSTYEEKDEETFDKIIESIKQVQN